MQTTKTKTLKDMQTIKRRKYCWYLGFFIILGLMMVKIYVWFLF